MQTELHNSITKLLTFWFLLIICCLNKGLSENSFRTSESSIWLLFKVGIVSVFRSASFIFDWAITVVAL